MKYRIYRDLESLILVDGLLMGRGSIVLPRCVCAAQVGLEQVGAIALQQDLSEGVSYDCA